MFTLYLDRAIIDTQTGERFDHEDGPLFLELMYDSFTEADRARVALDAVYGEGRVSIEHTQSYESRMGRF
jgi:hypothetical protein